MSDGRRVRDGGADAYRECAGGHGGGSVRRGVDAPLSTDGRGAPFGDVCSSRFGRRGVGERAAIGHDQSIPAISQVRTQSGIHLRGFFENHRCRRSA